MRRTLTAIPILVALGLSAHVLGQTVTPSVRPATQAPQIADPDLRQLYQDFGAISNWVRRKGAIGPDEQHEIEGFRRRLTGYLALHPQDPVALGLELQAALWLGDEAGAQSAFEQLEKVRPDDDTVRLTWAKRLLRRHLWEQTLAILQARPLQPGSKAAAAALEAECLVALGRFDQAIAVLDSVADGTATTPQVNADLQRVRTVAEACQPLWEAELLLREEEAQADDLPRVELDLERGKVVLELFENQAPNTVANFIDLVQKGFYDGTRFHRVLPLFMAQGGDPNTKSGSTGAPGTGGPGYRIAGEQAREDHRNHFTGSLAMAHNGDPDSGGSQFYICFEPASHLNGVHTVFGRVLEGMDVVNRIAQGDEIVSAKVLRKRDHEYKPETLDPLPPPPIPTPPSQPTGRIVVPPRVPPTTPPTSR